MRAVFDTNVVVSALLFHSGRLSPLRQVWARGETIPVVHKTTVSELFRVLQYPKFRLTPEDRNELLGEYLPCAEWFEAELLNSGFSCPDPFDRPFIDLAVTAGVDVLVSGDRDILEMADQLPCRVETPAAFLDRYR